MFLVLLSLAKYGQALGSLSVVISPQRATPLSISQGTIPSPMAVGRRHEHHPLPAVQKVVSAVRNFQRAEERL
jgi:hypothetical protein